MARNHFAIERPRKISISIQGYDAQAVTQAQQKKRMERNKREVRKAAATPPTVPAVATPSPAAPPRKQNAAAASAKPAPSPRLDEDEIEALGKAAAGKALNSPDQDLQRAFAAGGLAETGVPHAHE